MATAQQGQVVRLHRVVAEGHVSHEVAEVSCLHQPLPRCRRRTTPSGDSPRHVGPHPLGGMEGLVGVGAKVTGEGPYDHGRDPRPHSLSHPPTFLASYITFHFFSGRIRHYFTFTLMDF